jgi:hypothetical protein
MAATASLLVVDRHLSADHTLVHDDPFSEVPDLRRCPRPRYAFAAAAWRAAHPMDDSRPAEDRLDCGIPRSRVDRRGAADREGCEHSDAARLGNRSRLKGTGHAGHGRQVRSPADNPRAFAEALPQSPLVPELRHPAVFGAGRAPVAGGSCRAALMVAAHVRGRSIDATDRGRRECL